MWEKGVRIYDIPEVSNNFLSKRVETIIPLQVEVEAINWATQQALNLDAYSVTVESDATVYVEAIQKRKRADPWRIFILIANTIRLAHFS